MLSSKSHARERKVRELRNLCRKALGLSSRLLQQAASQRALQRGQCVWLRAALDLSSEEVARAIGRHPGSLRRLQAHTRHPTLRRARLGRLKFQDEAAIGRISEPRRCWAPRGIRPQPGRRLVRKYPYPYAAVSPHDGLFDALILTLPQPEREMGACLEV